MAIERQGLLTPPYPNTEDTNAEKTAFSTTVNCNRIQYNLAVRGVPRYLICKI